ncbi:MAG: hypothetical protein ACRDH6_08695 [Actinomycetota bacterium]
MIRRPEVRVAAFAAILMALPACGGDDVPTVPEPGASPPAASGALTSSGVESCLADAGVELATGETPTIEGELGIGIEPGSGPLLPGDLNAAVFVYASEEAATSAQTALQGAAFNQLVVSANALIVYAAPVSEETTVAIEACTSTG